MKSKHISKDSVKLTINKNLKSNDFSSIYDNNTIMLLQNIYSDQKFTNISNINRIEQSNFTLNQITRNDNFEKHPKNIKEKNSKITIWNDENTKEELYNSPVFINFKDKSNYKEITVFNEYNNEKETYSFTESNSKKLNSFDVVKTYENSEITKLKLNEIDKKFISDISFKENLKNKNIYNLNKVYNPNSIKAKMNLNDYSTNQIYTLDKETKEFWLINKELEKYVTDEFFKQNEKTTLELIKEDLNNLVLNQIKNNIEDVSNKEETNVLTSCFKFVNSKEGKIFISNIIEKNKWLITEEFKTITENAHLAHFSKANVKGILILNKGVDYEITDDFINI